MLPFASISGFFVNVFDALINSDFAEPLASIKQVNETRLLKLILLIVEIVLLGALVKLSGLILQFLLLPPFSCIRLIALIDR